MWITVKGKRMRTGWAREREEARERARKKFLSTWISPTRLKRERNWTDGAIKKFLSGVKPKPHTNYKGDKSSQYKFSDIQKVESTKAFKDWMNKRIQKQESQKEQ